MDGKRFKPDSNFVLNQCAKLHDGVDRISALPDEIIVVILSFLSLREAATTSVLSSRWLHLWKHTPNLKSDRISQLPDSIIAYILSFLPLKTAAATSVLCSRWLDLWKHTTNLNFTTYELKLDSHAENDLYKKEMLGLWDAEKCKYIQLVNTVIKSHKAPSLKQFAISFFVNISAKCIVAKWLECAFSRGVERLVLDFLCINPMFKVVLEELLRESGLCSSPQTLILFKSLERLCITHVNVSGEAVNIFLLNCPLLEELIISYSDLTSDVEVCGATLLLKHLEVSHCHGQKSLRVSAPNLTRLKFSDRLGKLFLESVPKLVEAQFKFQSQSVHDLQNAAPALSRLSFQLEILNLSLRWPKVFLANEFAEMPKLRKLVVEYCAPKTHSLLPVTALLWASPRLEEFKLEFTEIANGDAAAIQVRRNGERCRHLQLKLFELARLVDGTVGHIELVSYISDNCVGLEKIKIFLGSPPLFVKDLPWHVSAIRNQKQAARNYAEQRLQGKIPQHTQLQIFDHPIWVEQMIFKY